MSHVDEGRLHAFLDGALSAADPADAERVELHLAACADCRARLDEATRLRDEASALLGAAQPRVAATPSFDAILARAEAIAAEQGAVPARPTPGERRRRALLATPFNGFAWAATIVVAVGLGWMLRDNIGEGDRVALSAGSADAIETAAESDVVTESEVAEEAASSPVAGMDAAPQRDATEERAPVGYQAMSPPPAAPTGAAAREEATVGSTSGAGVGERRAADSPLAADYDVAPEELAVTSEAQRQIVPQTAEPARLESARVAAAPTPAAPPPAADVLGAGAGEADDGWRDVTLAEAERATDGGVVRLPGARIERVGLRSGAAEVRTVQITERGETVQVVQRRIFESAERRARESAMADATAEAPAIANSAKPATTVHVDDWTVTITGATQARLEELARSLD